ncbi:MAG: hypothetical protein LWX10_03685 [Spirochaetia bacterium]|nr:hypothetical protein [Spirochaetia bacterium]
MWRRDGSPFSAFYWTHPSNWGSGPRDGITKAGHGFQRLSGRSKSGQPALNWNGGQEWTGVDRIGRLSVVRPGP